MPKLSDFRQIDDEFYCWNSDINEFIQVELKPINNSLTYKKVTAVYMSNRIKDEKDTEGETE